MMSVFRPHHIKSVTFRGWGQELTISSNVCIIKNKTMPKNNTVLSIFGRTGSISFRRENDLRTDDAKIEIMSKIVV